MDMSFRPNNSDWFYGCAIPKPAFQGIARMVVCKGRRASNQLPEAVFRQLVKVNVQRLLPALFYSAQDANLEKGEL